MNKIKIVGLGPGHPSYIIPKGKKAIDESDIVVGAKRNLQSLDLRGKESLPITSKLDEVVDYIKSNYLEKKIAVIVSGDTGFYSFLRYLKKHFSVDQIEVIPGISSMQYMFSAIGETWDDAYIASLHGREMNFIEKVKKYKKIGLLTDKNWTPQKIAEKLSQEGLNNRTIYIGENLSYDNEKISRMNIEEAKDANDFDICVVVIVDED
ncbi:MAG: precorrin-6y C5,15-methyltransferase (decarboxylating) subunit CbiE [Firmicutes bacterium]|nr:precorrin-6y C5,15-methyltransferase (decarboxylating) subunit CbiE [Bacillota bacterium]